MKIPIPLGKSERTFFNDQPPLWLVAGTIELLRKKGYKSFLDGDTFAIQYYNRREGVNEDFSR